MAYIGVLGTAAMKKKYKGAWSKIGQKLFFRLNVYNA